MKIKLCDLVVEIKNRFPFVERLCRGYECDGEPVISVSVCDDEIVIIVIFTISFFNLLISFTSSISSMYETFNVLYTLIL